MLAHMIGPVGVAGLGVGVLFAVIIPPARGVGVARALGAGAPLAGLGHGRRRAPRGRGGHRGHPRRRGPPVTAGVTGRIAHGFMNPNLAPPFVALGGLSRQWWASWRGSPRARPAGPSSARSPRRVAWPASRPPCCRPC
ncbi:MAG: hypothetical protein R3F43_08585 [bacterium]